MILSVNSGISRKMNKVLDGSYLIIISPLIIGFLQCLFSNLTNRCKCLAL